MKLESFLKWSLRATFSDFYFILNSDLVSLEMARPQTLATEIYKIKTGITPPFMVDLLLKLITAIQDKKITLSFPMLVPQDLAYIPLIME